MTAALTDAEADHLYAPCLGQIPARDLEVADVDLVALDHLEGPS